MDKIDAVGAIADYNAYPDASGHFGRYGGTFVAETLIEPLRELDAAYRRYKDDPDFVAELQNDYRHYVGRPSPIYEAARLTKHVGGARILLKREDLNHTGAHKINNTSARRCWPRAWARPGSSPRPGPASMASRRPRLPRGSGWNAWCTWARSMSNGRRRTYSG